MRLRYGKSIDIVIGELFDSDLLERSWIRRGNSVVI